MLAPSVAGPAESSPAERRSAFLKNDVTRGLLRASRKGSPVCHSSTWSIDRAVDSFRSRTFAGPSRQGLSSPPPGRWGAPVDRQTAHPGAGAGPRSFPCSSVRPARPLIPSGELAPGRCRSRAGDSVLALRRGRMSSATVGRGEVALGAVEPGRVSSHPVLADSPGFRRGPGSARGSGTRTLSRQVADGSSPSRSSLPSAHIVRSRLSIPASSNGWRCSFPARTRWPGSACIRAPGTWPPCACS